MASSLSPSAFKASKIGAWLTGAMAVAVVFEESFDSGGKLSDIVDVHFGEIAIFTHICWIRLCEGELHS